MLYYISSLNKLFGDRIYPPSFEGRLVFLWNPRLFRSKSHEVHLRLGTEPDRTSSPSDPLKTVTQSALQQRGCVSLSGSQGALNLAALMNCGLLQMFWGFLFPPFNPGKFWGSLSSLAGGAGGSNCCEVCFTLSANKAK